MEHPGPIRLAEDPHLPTTILQIALSPLLACSAIVPLARGRAFDEPLLVWAGWSMVFIAVLALAAGMWNLQRALRSSLSLVQPQPGDDGSSQPQ